MAKKLRILKSPWHIAHDADLINALKPVANFDLLINFTLRWDEKIRKLPKNAKWVTHFEPGKYDLAILNIDQQCSNQDLNKSLLTQEMKAVIKEKEPKLPIIFINHGTPVYPERYPDGNAGNNFLSKQLRYEIMHIVGDDKMVVNSKQAASDWGTPYWIHHGMKAKEWVCDKTKEPRACTFISQAGIGDRYYNRSFLIGVMEELYIRYGIKLQWINTPGCFNARNIQEYKEFLGRSLVYFNPTYASPMPRSRTEAMLSGCCIVTTKTHDAEDFIVDGYNGFLISEKDVGGTAALIATLLKSKFKLAQKVGMNGRKTALQIFNRQRYREDWIKLLETLNILK